MEAEIISLHKVVFRGEFKQIIAPGTEGRLCILPSHVPLITFLKEGKLILKNENNKKFIFEIKKGILEINPQKVNILIFFKNET